MLKGICWGSLPPEMSFEDRLDLVAEAGFDGLEPRIAPADSVDFVREDAREQELRAAVRMAQDRGLKFCSVMGGDGWSRRHPIVSDDLAERGKGKELIRRALEITAVLEAEVLLFVPHWLADQVRYDVAWNRTLEALADLASVAESLKVVIAIENVWNKFLLSPLEFVRLIDEVGSPAVRAYFDVGNVMVLGYPEQWIEILGPRIARVHVKDFRTDINNIRGFVQLLHGDVNWPAVMRALRAVGYDSWLTAEVGRYRHFPKESVFDTAVALDRLMALG